MGALGRAPRRRTLADGTAVAVRPLMPSDRTWLAVAFAELSATSRYRRFLAPLRTLSENMLVELVDRVDQHDHVALVAIADPGGPGEARIGVGRFIRDPAAPSHAEVAVTVGDLWQGRGVGSHLIDMLVAEARDRGIDVFTATLAPDNAASLAMLARAGPFIYREMMTPGQLDVAMDLRARLTGQQGRVPRPPTGP